MSAENGFAQDITARQVRMFAMFVGEDPRTQVTRAALAAASGIPASTLKSWATGTAMPVHGLLTLRKFLPPEAINMITEVGGARLVTISTRETNWDQIAAGAAGLVGEVCEARKDGTIDHVEDDKLKRRTRALIAELSEVVSEG